VPRWRNSIVTSALTYRTTTTQFSAQKLRQAVTGVHGLIRNAKGHYDAGYKVEEGQHLRPYKRLLVDVTASSAALDKALGFANYLFNALESAGYRVLISSRAEGFTRPHIDDHEQLPKIPRNERSYDYNRLWSPQRPTVVYVGSVAFGLAVIEMSESVVLQYVNGKYIRESDYKPPKSSARYLITVGRRRRTFLVAASEWSSTRRILASPGRYRSRRARSEC
jgi:hypothetical protein